VVDEHGSRRGDDVRRVQVGSRVRVRDVGADEEDEDVIVSRVGADISQGRISDQSPVGRKLLGRVEGEEVVVRTPGGVRHLVVVDVSGAG
jgi:transcription elongation factor GreA